MAAWQQIERLLFYSYIWGRIVKLKPIVKGDIVDVVAPASKCTRKELKRAIASIRALGLKPRIPKDLFGRSELFSNSDAVRLKHLKAAVSAKDSSMIWCVRGGYGAIRLMPAVEKWPRPKQTKIFLGFSDITTLHSHFNRKWNWPTLHGPLMDRLGRDAMSAGEKRELLNMLFGRTQSVEFAGLTPMNAAASRRKKIRASVLGGNFTVLQSSLGTPSAFKPGGCILFLEDTGERPHRVDRMLTQAAQAGWFKDVRAVVFGYFQLNDAKDRRILWSDVMDRFARSMKVPVFKGLPVGHDPKRQFTMPFNTPAVLQTGRKGTLTVQTGISAK